MSDAIAALVAQHQPRVVTLDLSRVFDLEYSALQALMEAERRLTKEGTVFWLAGLSPTVLAGVKASGFADHLGKERLYINARAAIRHYQQ